ncbi:MAG: hypothetical protein L0Y76_08575 [Ignavibacteria bacterium]|nr:hypothetical protein [Ignavibacteria bacterium]
MKKFSSIIMTLLLLSVVSEILAKPEFNFNGDIQYRIRYHWTLLKSSQGKDSSAAPDLTSLYAWNLLCKIRLNENMQFGLRLSNPVGYSADIIKDNASSVSEGNYNLLSIPELYFKWTISSFHLSAGIIPVIPNTILGLAVYDTKKFLGAGTDPWDILMNNSQKGLNLGFDFIRQENASFGVDIIAAMAEDAKPTDTANALIHDQIRLIVSFPTKLLNNKLTFLPVMHTRFNAYRSLDLEDANHAITGGCDVKMNILDNLSASLGAAGGMLNNECQKGDSMDTNNDKKVDAPIAQTSPLGMLFSAGVVYTDKLGKAVVDFNFGRSRDREASPALNNNVFFWDIKYNLPVKSLIILPRMRVWYFTKEESDKAELRLRPELILKAAF